MATLKEVQERENRRAAFRERLIDVLGPQLASNPALGVEIERTLDKYDAEAEEAGEQSAEDTLSGMIGLGSNVPADLGGIAQQDVDRNYDDTVTPERIRAVGDLYYIYQHERLGIFRTVLKLQELFNAGTVRLSSGKGALGLYRFDRQKVLRYSQQERAQAYRRVFGYTQAVPPPGARPNHEFHGLFVHFVTEVAEFFRDKRVSEVIRPNADDPSYGSIAVVRRAGLDLRNNVKDASYGHVMVMRMEVMDLLRDAFEVLSQPDILRLFGSDTAWDVIEEVMRRYLGEPNAQASSRNRLAGAGRDILNWLATPYIMNSNRTQFETLLLQIGDRAEEWVTSAESLGVSYRRPREVPPRRDPLPGMRRPPVRGNGRVAGPVNGSRVAEW